MGKCSKMGILRDGWVNELLTMEYKNLSLVCGVVWRYSMCWKEGRKEYG